MAKIGAISLAGVVALILIFFLLIPVLSSEAKREYVLGEKVKIEMPGDGFFKVKIESPSGVNVYDISGALVFEPSDIGKYEVSYEGKVLEFIVVGKEEINAQNSVDESILEEVENGSENFSSYIKDEVIANERRENSGEQDTFYDESDSEQIAVGRPVLHKENFDYLVNSFNEYLG